MFDTDGSRIVDPDAMEFAMALLTAVMLLESVSFWVSENFVALPVAGDVGAVTSRPTVLRVPVAC